MKVHSLIAWLIASFVAATITSLNAEDANAGDFEPYMHIGGQTNVSDATQGGFGVLYKNKIDFNVTYMGEGDTKWGKHESARIVSISRIITPGWFNNHFFMGLGYSNVQNSLMVGEHNAHLMLGFQWDRARVWLGHHSDFDIGTNNNSGLDSGQIGINLYF